ncbi:MAG: preprotein translocase subunit SecE, partial [Acidiferrobacterales bacterium]
GILANLFTALFVSRMVMEFLVQKGIIKSLHMMRIVAETKIPFMSLKTPAFVVSVLLVAGGIYGFYYFEAQGDLVRIATVLGATIVAAGVALTSAPGQNAWEFAKGARTELRKVVWPSSKETLQVTLAVLAIVVMVSLFLMLVDYGLSNVRDALLGLES